MIVFFSCRFLSPSEIATGAACPVPQLHADDYCWLSPFKGRLAGVVDNQVVADICGGRVPIEDDGVDPVFRWMALGHPKRYEHYGLFVVRHQLPA